MPVAQVDPSAATHGVDRGTEWLFGQSPIVIVLTLILLAVGWFFWRKLSPLFDKQAEAIEIIKEHAPQTSEALTSLARSAKISNRRLQKLDESHIALHEKIEKLMGRECKAVPPNGVRQ